MKNMIISAICVFTLFTSNISIGQELSILSPKAKIETRAGITDITIDYNRPAARGREIFGELVPYDEMWRTGANSSTKINFSKQVTVSGTKLKAGEYVLVSIPGKTEWTIMLNKNPKATIWNYPKEDEVVSFKVKPVACPFRERFTILIPDFDDGKAVINLEWTEVSVPIKVELHTADQIDKNIESAFGDWSQGKVARYYKEQKEWDKGLIYIDKAIKLSDDYWYYYWLKAQILAGKESYKEALPMAQKAFDLGTKPDVDFWYKEPVEKALVDWKKK